MLIYVFLELLLWFLKFCYVSPCLLYVVSLLLLIICERWIKVFALMYCITLVYGMIKSSAVGLIRYLYSALSPLYSGSHVWETINNYTIYLSSLESSLWVGYLSSPLLSPSVQLQWCFENFEKLEYSWHVETSTVLALLLGISMLLNVVQLLSKVKQLFKKITQISALRLDNYGWQGVWGSMGKYLEKWAPPVFWKFTPEQVQDPEELVKYLEKVCCHPGSSREIQITATCWSLAHAYRALFDTTQYPQGEEKVSGPNNKMMSIAAAQTLATGTMTTPAPATRTVATQTSATGTAAPPAMATSTAATQTSAAGTVVPPAPATSAAATQTLATDTAVIQNPASGTAAEPADQPAPVSVAPVQKKKYMKKSVRLAKDEGEPGSSREQGEKAEPEIITRSLSLSELRDMRKDFGCHIGEHIVTWLLRCWDNGANSLELEGREAKQLGSLAREGGIDKTIGKGTQAISLWRQLLSSVKERYPFKEDVICQSSKWTIMERGIQYLRELAVLETIHHDPDNPQLPKDPDEVQCTRPMW
ncbi:uncharacterized protein LOC142033685 [Buteo buteo]|uniref:uncharacterized protein LOC142033685 n=1 Tax=Buteo buteo TaxID=30397 RepID=UPI003EB6FAC5